jgi:hypothetical protein
MEFANTMVLPPLLRYRRRFCRTEPAKEESARRAGRHRSVKYLFLIPLLASLAIAQDSEHRLGQQGPLLPLNGLNVVTHGATCDGVTNTTSAINSILVGIGSKPTKLIFPSGRCLLSNIVFPSNVTLDFTQGGAIAIVSGQSVTIKGSIDADYRQIFTNVLAGQGTVSFAGNTTFTNGISPLYFGVKCDGVTDNSPAWAAILSIFGDSAPAFLLPAGCVDMHASAITVSSRAGFTLKTETRTQNGGGRTPAKELWNGTSGGMWDLRANEAPTIEGLLFTNNPGKSPAYFIRLDGEPSAHIGTEAVIRFNTFTNIGSNPIFEAITINKISGQNHEKNVILDNDFFCSQARANRLSDSGQISIGSATLTCGLGNCRWISDPNPDHRPHVGDRLRVSYATGILDTSVRSVTDDNHLQMAATSSVSQSSARITVREALGRGIVIGSTNSKHNTISRNSFTQCAVGVEFINGSASGEHFGGSANDVLLKIDDISEASEFSYLEDENSMRDVYLGPSIDAPLTLRHLRNSLGSQGESDGFIYFSNGGRVNVEESLIQDTPKANSVVFGAPHPANVLFMSVGNQWAPGVTTMANLGFTVWRTYSESGSPAAGYLISIGDNGIKDAPAPIFFFGSKALPGGGTTPPSLFTTGATQQDGIGFAKLGTAIPGKFVWCLDCRVGDPCAASGTGAWAFGVAGPSWRCPF